ncbi:MAG: Fic family protein [Bacteroidetes bacterium]|nr:MAG: Fic family protein [Bacteroidota bacterium]
MATPGQKLAESLEKLKELQDRGIVGIKADDLTRVHRERLLDNGFIRNVVKGWYVVVPPNEQAGDSTSWYVSFWGFCASYLNDRYGEDYCISAEQSLMHHTGDYTVPKQLIVRSTKGNNLPTNLLFNTSVFVMKSTLPQRAEIEIKNRLRIVNLPSAIIHSGPSIFDRQQETLQIALTMMMNNLQSLLRILLDGGHSQLAGRIAGAYRSLGHDNTANDILETMKAAGYDVRETNPFNTRPVRTFTYRGKSPYVHRIKLLWEKMRPVVAQIMPEPPGIPANKAAYLEQMEEIYTTDAYHSLSIEKYSVTPALIERVKLGDWNVHGNEDDKKHRDALAARGYWQAFNAVKSSIHRIFAGENAGKVVNADHNHWYREMFAPGVSAGLLKPSDLAGYRNNQVYIARSRHIPINYEVLPDAMETFFELLEQEENAGVRAVLGHFIFVYIHPYVDGNGRMGRFLMNTMLAAGGYPWTVIPVQERDTYMKALENASVLQDIKSFAEFIAWLVEGTLKGKPIARLH